MLQIAMVLLLEDSKLFEAERNNLCRRVYRKKGKGKGKGEGRLKRTDCLFNGFFDRLIGRSID